MKTTNIIIAITLANMLSLSTVVLGGDYLLTQKNATTVLQTSENPMVSEAMVIPTKSTTTILTTGSKSTSSTQVQQTQRTTATTSEQSTAPVNTTATVQESTQTQPQEVAVSVPVVTEVPPPPPPTDPPPQPSGCIITIDGASYDVTSFRNAHSGGDIFSCGADMSAAFWGQHGNKELTKMQKYRI